MTKLVSFSADLNPYVMALKVEAKGGKGGNQWDDGSDYEDVTKIHVRGGLQGIQFIKFEYVKAGNAIVGPIHGVYGRGFTQTVSMLYVNISTLFLFEDISTLSVRHGMKDKC